MVEGIIAKLKKHIGPEVEDDQSEMINGSSARLDDLQLLLQSWEKSDAIKRFNEEADARADDFGNAPKQHAGTRTRMSIEEERRRQLKRKLDHKAKLARKHSRSTVAEY